LSGDLTTGCICPKTSVGWDVSLVDALSNGDGRSDMGDRTLDGPALDDWGLVDSAADGDRTFGDLGSEDELGSEGIGSGVDLSLV